MVSDTFESLYEKFIVEKYGESFYKYTLFLNIGVLLFLISIVSLYFIDDGERRNAKK